MLKKLLYRECKECGTPWIVSKFYKWGNDGTMGMNFRDIQRTVLLNASMYDNLVEDINVEVGAPIWHLVYESHRNIGRMTVESLFEKDTLLSRLIKWRFVRNRIGNYYHEVSALMGYCLSTTAERHSDTSVSGYIKNPFNLYCVAGAIVAALEALRGIPYECSWEELGLNEYKVTVWSVDEWPEISKRFIEEPAKIKEGHISLERCSSCRMPKRAAELFEWRRHEGKLMNRKSGDRWCAFVSNNLPPIFRLLAEELGDDIYDSLIRTQCEWTIKHLDRLGVVADDSPLSPEEAVEAFKTYLKDFPVFGYGNPVSYRIEEESCSITIENPFFVQLEAGILLGLYEGLFQKKADIRWERLQDYIAIYTIETEEQKEIKSGKKSRSKIKS